MMDFLDVVKPPNQARVGIVQVGIVVLVQGSTTDRLKSLEAVKVVDQLYAGRIVVGIAGQMGVVVGTTEQVLASDLSAVQIARLTVFKVVTVPVIMVFGIPVILMEE